MRKVKARACCSEVFHGASAAMRVGPRHANWTTLLAMWVSSKSALRGLGAPRRRQNEGRCKLGDPKLRSKVSSRRVQRGHERLRSGLFGCQR